MRYFNELFSIRQQQILEIVKEKKAFLMIKGKIHFQRDSVSNRRFMSRPDVINLLNANGLLIDDTNTKKRDVIYAR